MRADTSARTEMLRRTGSPTDQAMQAGLARGEIAVTDSTVMWASAGATSTMSLAGMRAALDACRYVAQRRFVDAAAAAELHRDCRRGGETPRQVDDCLVAAVAIRVDVPVLHHDRDVDVTARHTALGTARA